MSIQISSWYGLHREGWGKRLCPASFAHPAKNSYGLSVRIYEHALEEGWVKPGDYVVDCFSGVGGFALEAMRHGLNFVGVELEMRFCDMGQGCDCTGIGKADWVRFQGRWDKMRYEGGRHWCPECLARAGAVTGEREFKPLPLPGTKWAAIAKARQPMMFDATPSTSYARNSGRIPCTGPHHYRGNIETWERQGMAGSAVIVQGDSRRLGEVLERASLCLSSPPYADQMGANCTGTATAKDHFDHSYGQADGQLGNLPDTGFEAALSPPGYVVVPEKPQSAAESPQATERVNHSASTEAQEGAGQPVLALSSPPFQSTYVKGGETKGFHSYDKDEAYNRCKRDYDIPQSDGQLAQMPKGDLVAVISSPPFVQVMKGQKASDKGRESRARRFAQGKFKAARPDCFSSATNIGHAAMDAAAYGNSDGQLAALPPGDHAEACERPRCCIASPPYARDAELHGDLRPDDQRPSGRVSIERNYGRGQGQLAQMSTGDHAAAAARGCSQQALEAGAETPACADRGRAQACISSPPFLGTLNSRDPETFSGLYRDPKFSQSRTMVGTYGHTKGQLGEADNSTFWAASREILEQVYQVLAPGGHAIWVVKMFVRNKKLVNFPGQWEALCQSVGFKTVCKHRAWLNKNTGIVQTTLDGDEVSMEKWYKSFFRILCEKKGAPRIDWELVLCMVKE